MRKEVYYYADGDPRPYNTEEDALRVEVRNKERYDGWLKNNVDTKLMILKDNLDKAMYIHPSTIATCTFECLQMKALVKVCQAFAEENKKYLDYY